MGHFQTSLIRGAWAMMVLIAVFLPAGSHASFRAFTPEGDGPTQPATANGRLTEVPSLPAYPLAGQSITVDGKLDDAAWGNAVTGSGFRVWDPDRGAAPSEETVFKVAYDSDAIYFAVACLEKDPANITSNLARRDRFSDSDLVSVYIDPYFDRNTGYNFKVNPEGVKVDAYMYNDGDRDENWNAVWDTETYRDENGWYAEIRVPFSSIRYRPADDMTWGLQVYRYMHGRGEDTAWTVWDREKKGFISRFGTLEGLHDVPAPRQLEVLPYFLGQSVDHATSDPQDGLDNSANAGVDVKYGVTADLTLNATVQPDFGQVEADPATLNLSPFETFYEEKRPFFVEGSRFFRHPDFNLFYSRRIGTGHPHSRIRTAGKLTGKTKSNWSVGWLAATTDVTERGRAMDFFRSGINPQSYLVGRMGKEFDDAKYQFNLMGTYAHTNGGEWLYDGEIESVTPRDALTGGMDFDLYFKDREYNIQGSMIGSHITEDGAEDRNGTGGNLDVRKVAGNFQTGVYGRWESDELDLNDVGFLSAPDEIGTGYWASYNYNPEGESSTFNRANFNFNWWNSWLYGGRTGYDVDTGDPVWSYDRRTHQGMGGNVNGWMQFRNYYEGWWGVEVMPESRQRYETRGGPLMTEPTTYGGWWGVQTDYRKRFNMFVEGNYFVDTADNSSLNLFLGTRWNMSSAVTSEFRVGFRNRIDDTQWLENVTLSDPDRAGSNGTGIGGVSYVFGGIHQQTLDVTLRSSILFSRDSSLELYLQPFVTVGDYANARELASPDSYDFLPYTETRSDGSPYRAEDFDFSYAAVNFNLVYRWEFRPASTLFLVWTHNRERFEERGPRNDFRNGIDTGTLFDEEGENVFMAKIAYWFSI